jgi:hypothetical protein
VGHGIVRPFLWRLGVGISVPGQFLVASASLFAAMDAAVDTYLDDLYLGIFARSVPGTLIFAESAEAIGVPLRRTTTWA